MSRRVQFLRGTVLDAGVGADVGDEADVEDALALQWVKQGRAIYVDGEGMPDDSGIITPPEPPKAKATRVR